MSTVSLVKDITSKAKESAGSRTFNIGVNGKEKSSELPTGEPVSQQRFVILKYLQVWILENVIAWSYMHLNLLDMLDIGR